MVALTEEVVLNNGRKKEKNDRECLIPYEIWRSAMNIKVNIKCRASRNHELNFEWLKLVDLPDASLRTASEAGHDRANAGADWSSVPQIKDPRFPMRPVVAYLQRPEPIAVEALDELSRDDMRSGARRFGLQIAAVCIEHCARGRSGHRPALQEAIAFCKRGGAGGVIVDDLDRLSRRAWILPSLMHALQSCDCGLWDLRRGRIGCDPISNMRASLAYEDFKVITERMRQGRRVAAAVRRTPER